MKKVLGVGVILLVMLLAACGEEDAEPTKDDQKDKETDQVEEVSAEPEEDTEEEGKDTKDADDTKSEESEIDTSMYEYAEDIEVKDALELNDHITLMIDMPEDNTQGLTFQHVVNQTYDFLQQDSAKEAKTIGINIRQGGNKIAMFTVHPDEFKTDDDDIAMADLVLDASVVNMALPEIEEYAKDMDMKLNKE